MSFRPIRILCIDDNEGVLNDYRRIFTAQPARNSSSAVEIETLLFGESPRLGQNSEVGFRHDTAMQGEEGIQKLRDAIQNNDPYQLAFVDMRMPPGWDGLETIQRIWNESPDVFIVLCTAYSDHTFQDIRAKLGNRSNFLILKKPFHPDEVLQHAVKVGAKLATPNQSRPVDPLTGFWSRKAFLDKVDFQLACPEWKNRNGTMFLIDIDQFDANMHGRPEAFGEAILQLLSKNVVSACSLDNVIIGRTGSDDVAVFGEMSDSCVWVQSLKDLTGYQLFQVGGLRQGVHLSLSAGIAEFAIQEETGPLSAEQLLSQCQIALKEAKRLGHGKCVSYRKEIIEEVVQLGRVESELAHAIENEELHLFFQPIINISSGKIIGFEALLRWLRDGQPLAAPDIFIPVAERIGAIIPIGDWVVDEAINAVRQFRLLDGWEHLFLTINVSHIQLAVPDFIPGFLAKLECSGLDNTAIRVEITESCFVQSGEEPIQALEVLRKEGLKVYMDDFGSGYSSLGQLTSMPFDVIKLDRTFLIDSEQNPFTWKMMQGVIYMIQSLEKEVVAEGVETRHQLDMLGKLKCEMAQGYHISKPIPLPAVGPFLELHQSLDALKQSQAA